MKDYRALLRGTLKPTGDCNISELERFFRGQWFKTLCDLDGEEIMRQIRSQVQKEKEKEKRMDRTEVLKRLRMISRFKYGMGDDKIEAINEAIRLLAPEREWHPVSENPPEEGDYWVYLTYPEMKNFEYTGKTLFEVDIRHYGIDYDWKMHDQPDDGLVWESQSGSNCEERVLCWMETVYDPVPQAPICGSVR